MEAQQPAEHLHTYQVEGLGEVTFKWQNSSKGPGVEISGSDELGSSYRGSVESPFVDSHTLGVAFEGKDLQVVTLAAAGYSAKTMSITLKINFPVLRRTAEIILTKEEESTETQVAMLKEQLFRARKELKELKSRGRSHKAWGLASTFSAPASWTDVPNAALDLTVGKDNADVRFGFFFHGHAVGGYGAIRVVMDAGTKDELIFGSEPTYGMLWTVPSYGTWHHLHLVEVLAPVPAGRHSFVIQAKSTGTSFQLHPGNDGQLYSRNYFELEEL